MGKQLMRQCYVILNPFIQYLNQKCCFWIALLKIFFEHG
jgi:hypothetical protein